MSRRRPPVRGSAPRAGAGTAVARGVALGVALAAAAAPLRAQDRGGPRVGERVRVDTGGREPAVGTVAAVDAAGLWLAGPGGVVTARVRPASVRGYQRRVGTTPARGARRGALAGALVGGVLLAAGAGLDAAGGGEATASVAAAAGPLALGAVVGGATLGVLARPARWGAAEAPPAAWREARGGGGGPAGSAAAHVGLALRF